MVDRARATVIARRAAEGIPRVQTSHEDPVTVGNDHTMVRISARIPTIGRDALRRVAAAHGLSVASLIELLSAAAADGEEQLLAVVATRADRHRRAWGGSR
ncbi:MAG: hypothetical protein ACR2HR_16445 [Euzebya sp.]